MEDPHIEDGTVMATELSSLAPGGQEGAIGADLNLPSSPDSHRVMTMNKKRWMVLPDGGLEFVVMWGPNGEPIPDFMLRSPSIAPVAFALILFHEAGHMMHDTPGAVGGRMVRACLLITSWRV